MLRSNHVLSLALLISVPAFAMENGALVAAQEGQKEATSSALLATVMLAENHKSELATYKNLEQQELTIAAAKKVTADKVASSLALYNTRLTEKTKALEGSTTAIQTLKSKLAQLKVDTPQREAALKAQIAKEETDLLTNIAKEEEAKKTLEADIAKIKKDLAPQEETTVATQAATPAPTAPTPGLFARWFGSSKK